MLFNGMHHLPPIVFCIHQTEPADYHHFIVRIYAWKERRACRRIPFRLFDGCILGEYTWMYLLRGDFAFEAYLRQIIMPELVYTILVTLILYQIILHINKKLEAEEQRSASKFV